MVRCVKLVMKDGSVIPFTPEASLPCARDTDGILGSLGLDVGFIFYIKIVIRTMPKPLEHITKRGYIHIRHLVFSYIAHCATTC